MRYFFQVTKATLKERSTINRNYSYSEDGTRNNMRIEEQLFET